MYDRETNSITLNKLYLNKNKIKNKLKLTEQEIKNEFYRRNSTNNALSFKYNLVDFYIPEAKLQDKNENRFLSVLKDYQLTGKLPAE